MDLMRVCAGSMSAQRGPVLQGTSVLTVPSEPAVPVRMAVPIRVLAVPGGAALAADVLKGLSDWKAPLPAAATEVCSNTGSKSVCASIAAVLAADMMRDPGDLPRRDCCCHTRCTGHHPVDTCTCQLLDDGLSVAAQGQKLKSCCSSYLCRHVCEQQLSGVRSSSSYFLGACAESDVSR